MTKLEFLKRSWVFDGIVISINLFTIAFLFKAISFIDVKDHNLLLINYLEAGYFPLPPGYYSLIYVVDWILRIKYPFVASSILVLTFFLWWKYRLLFRWLQEEVRLEEKQSFGLVLSFLFLSPIYIPAIDGDFWYLGKFTQTIWHNSTLITVFPFCILLTQYSLAWIDKFQKRDLFFMLAFAFAILLIKPSFLFCFIPALPTYLFLRDRGLSTQVIQATSFVILLFLLLLLEKYLIFTWDPMIDRLYTSDEKSEVIIYPFRVWLFYSDQPVFDFLSSVPLLILGFIFWWKDLWKSSFFQFTLILLIYALIVYLTFSETGFREFHGNFYWQIPVALSLNTFSILFVVIRELRGQKKMRLRHFLFALIYVIQVLLGLAYWLRIFIERTLS